MPINVQGCLFFSRPTSCRKLGCLFRSSGSDNRVCCCQTVFLKSQIKWDNLCDPCESYLSQTFLIYKTLPVFCFQPTPLPIEAANTPVKEGQGFGSADAATEKPDRDHAIMRGSAQCILGVLGWGLMEGIDKKDLTIITPVGSSPASPFCLRRLRAVLFL